MSFVFACVLLVIPTQTAKPLPISAHNCYPANSTSNARLIEAVALGIDNIEIDLGWDDKNKRLIVGHDSAPVNGKTYPTFQTYIEFFLNAPERPDHAPTVLSIDWKTSRPEAVDQFNDFLNKHASLFSTAPKAEPSPFKAQRFTVCFTGSEQAKAHYDSLIPAGGTYRAFCDRVYGAGDYKDNAEDYARKKATAYHRFLTMHWAVVEKGAPILARGWTESSEKRLKAIVDAAHHQGYRLRFYCLNGAGNMAYRFPTEEAAKVRWVAAAKAGVDWVASDDYENIVHTLSSRSR